MPARKDMSEDFPLRGGPVVCGSCGYSLTGGWSKGKYKKYPYYSCHHQGCPERGKSIPASKLHENFEGVLKSLQPSRPYLGMVKSMFVKAWDTQAAWLADTVQAHARKARELETEIGKVVDRMLEVTNPRALKAFEDRIESLERDKLIALEKAAQKPKPTRPFEEMFELSMRFLANPYDCWKIGGQNARKLVVRLAFDAPLQYTRKTGCLNTEISSVFSLLEGLKMPERKLVRSRRLELPPCCQDSDLNAARLPIPPRPHVGARKSAVQPEIASSSRRIKRRRADSGATRRALPGRPAGAM